LRIIDLYLLVLLLLEAGDFFHEPKTASVSIKLLGILLDHFKDERKLVLELFCEDIEVRF
jgi:hypothetical protein